MQSYPWLIPLYQQLLSPQRLGRAPHAWIIGYRRGGGENILISYFIATLFCENSPTDPCGHCHACHLYHAGTHPDFYLVEVEKDRSFIRIDQIRAVLERVYEYAQQRGVKVVWIKEAGRLTEAASHALLKTVEEPPANTIFILSDEQPDHLLLTLRSRCQCFYICPPDLATGMAWLRQRCPTYSENERATALLLHQNAPLAAEQLLQPEAWQRRSDFYEAITKALSNGDFWALLPEFNCEDPATKLYWFSSLLVDALKARARAGKYIVNRDKVSLIRAFSGYDIHVLHGWQQNCQMTTQYLTQIPGVNESLILADMLAQSEMKISFKSLSSLIN